MLKKVKNSLFGELKSHFPYYLLLTTVLVLALFIRVYRVGDLMGFYYDQGRDALVIWRLWYEGKLFLIGPVTGLAGIFLGPFYYYLIAPFYLIGGGNPVYPAVFLAFLSTLAVLMLYVLGTSMHSRTAGIIAAVVGAFSYNIVTFGRWLSNPNPMFLISLLLLWFMWRIVYKSNKMAYGSKSQRLREWIAIFFLVGVSLHFEAASAVFYIPMIFVFILFNRKHLPDIKVWLISIGFFAVTILPQVIFNFRHDNILVDNFLKLFLKEKAFRGISKFIFEERMAFFWRVFSTKLYAGWNKHAFLFIILSFSAAFVKRKKIKHGLLSLFIVFLLTPLFFYTFFQGNFGNIYDYYLSGYFMPFILIFSIGLAELYKTYIGKAVVLFFFITFFSLNSMLIRNYLTATTETRPISLKDELGVIGWLLDDVEGKGDFNLDVYVPPVIPHSYEYLFLWQASLRCEDGLCGRVDEQRELLYTLYEEDPPHPERLENWLEKYSGNTKVQSEKSYGNITVQRRKRLSL
ncbi:MAG: glycosyltransferase family 39 protein [Thermodesulfovibrionia bacterium]|nr:glycosyltransferase family 39 protein [Thermodesulfovibrionia bacterium]